MGDPADPLDGLVFHCEPRKQCFLKNTQDGSQIYKVMDVALGEDYILPVLKRIALSFESVFWPGYYIVERLKDGKRIITLDTVDLSSKADRKFVSKLYYLFEAQCRIDCNFIYLKYKQIR